MTSRVVVLGGGTGGTLAANRLRRVYRLDEAEITVVDQDDRHVYQPGLLFVPFGLTHAEDIVRPRDRQLRDGIAFRRVRHRPRRHRRQRGASDRRRRASRYDVLVVATGARLVPGGDRGSDRAGVDGEGVHLLHTRGRRRARRRRWRRSTAAGSS